MDCSGIPSAQEIQAEHDRWGHTLGWRLLYSPMRTIECANVALITMNPAGNEREEARISVEDGSAYVLEPWKGRAPGTENLQQQVRRMFDILAVAPDNALAGCLVPFRSPSWSLHFRTSPSRSHLA